MDREIRAEPSALKEEGKRILRSVPTIPPPLLLHPFPRTGKIKFRKFRRSGGGIAPGLSAPPAILESEGRERERERKKVSFSPTPFVLRTHTFTVAAAPTSAPNRPAARHWKGDTKGGRKKKFFCEIAPPSQPRARENKIARALLPPPPPPALTGKVLSQPSSSSSVKDPKDRSNKS